MKRRLISLLLVIAIMCALAGCGSSEKGSAGNSEDKHNSYIFTDDAGREVEVSTEITRIVPSSSLAQIVLMAIAPEMFAGLSAELVDSAKGIVPDYLFKLPRFGNLYSSADLNIEELALTAPDIIIDIGEPKNSTKEDLDALQEQTLIPSVFISASLETMPDTYRKLGKLLGKEARGEELAQFCEKVYNRTVSVMEKVGDNKVSCLYVLGEEGLNVIAATSYHAELLDLLTNNLAVVDNPQSKGSGNEVTMEQISIWNPDFVIFGPGSIYSTVKEAETWNQLNAIVNDNYVEVPDAPYNWLNMPPSAQRYLGLIWLPYVLYPDYCDYDAKTEIIEYYELFYGCTVTEEQYNTITANAFLK